MSSTGLPQLPAGQLARLRGSWRTITIASLCDRPCPRSRTPKRCANGSLNSLGIGTACNSRSGLSASSGRAGAFHRNMCIAPIVKDCVAP